MALLILCCTHWAWGAQWRAGAIVVNTTADELNADGDCSLREAIEAANGDAAVDACPAGAGADTIVLPAGVYYLTLTGASEDNNATGDLEVKEELTILGSGIASTYIDGNNSDRVFHIWGSSLHLSNLRILNGTPAAGEDGGGILVDCGSLEMAGVWVLGNTAARGGGICTTCTTSSVKMADSLITGNTSTSEIFGGGGLFITGALVARHSSISGNEATGTNGSGAGAYVYSGSAKIVAVTFRANTAAVSGGGLFLSNSPSSIEIRDTTFNMNSAAAAAAIHTYAPTDIINSTIRGNTATNEGSVAGVMTTQGVTNIRNSTIVYNNSGGVNTAPSPAAVNVTHSIVAFNGEAYGSEFNCGYGVTSQGYNIENGTSCGFTSTGDLQNTDPRLSGLGLNGGTTNNYAPRANSPAVDGGDPSGCLGPDALPLIVDQRGYSRPVDGDGDGTDVCDIGSVEFGSGPASLKLFIGHLPVRAPIDRPRPR